MADETDSAERVRLSELFANQIENALDSQGGNMQVALWSVEESFNKKFDHIHEQIGNSNTLQSAVLEAVNGLRADVQQSATEVATRLKKHDDDIETLLSIQTEHTARLDVLDDLEEWRVGVDDRLSKIEQADRDDIRTEIKNTNAEIASMKEMFRRYDTQLLELVDRLAARGGGEDAEQASDALPDG